MLYTALHWTVLYSTAVYCTVLYCTVWYCTVLYCTVLHCKVLYCTILYCTVLYDAVQYDTVLYSMRSYPQFHHTRFTTYDVPKHVRKSPSWSSCECCTDALIFYFGSSIVTASTMLFTTVLHCLCSDYNQSPRNMYQCQMGKQVRFPLILTSSLSSSLSLSFSSSSYFTPVTDNI